MKNIKILTIALIVIASYSNQLFAQEVSAVAPAKASYDLKKNVKARVSQTDGNVTPIDEQQEPKTQEALKTRTKSNQCNERSSGSATTIEEQREAKTQEALKTSKAPGKTPNITHEYH